MTHLSKVTDFIKKFWKRILFCILFFFMILNQLFWLLLLMLGVFVLRFIFLFFIKFIKNKTLSKIAKGLLFFTIIFAVSISIKLFVFGIFKIPSSSMENTLYPNDIILVNKLVYGPKLPSTPFEIPWINLLFYLNDNARLDMDKDWWEYQRFSGLNKIEQGDVLVFQETRTFFIVKRCVGLPGDTFKMINGEVFTNNKKYTPPLDVKESYNIIVKNKETFYNQVDSLKMEIMLNPSYKINNKIEGMLSKKEFLETQKLGSVVSIEKKLKKQQLNDRLFLDKNTDNWTADNMGVFTIPKKGFQIELNDKTFNLYKNTLQKFENIQLEKKEDNFFLDGKKASNYIFKKDYIFVLGDYREVSEDSRFIGFVPVESVVGKVQSILYSNYNDVFNWDRLFKGVN